MEKMHEYESLGMLLLIVTIILLFFNKNVIPISIIAMGFIISGVIKQNKNGRKK